MSNGDMLESHGCRPFSNTVHIKVVKCKRTGGRILLLLERFQYLERGQHPTRNSMGGLSTAPLKLDYRSFFSLESIYRQTLPERFWRGPSVDLYRKPILSLRHTQYKYLERSSLSHFFISISFLVHRATKILAVFDHLHILGSRLILLFIRYNT